MLKSKPRVPLLGVIEYFTSNKLWFSKEIWLYYSHFHTHIYFFSLIDSYRGMKAMEAKERKLTSNCPPTRCKWKIRKRLRDVLAVCSSKAGNQLPSDAWFSTPTPVPVSCRAPWASWYTEMRWKSTIKELLHHRFSKQKPRWSNARKVVSCLKTTNHQEQRCFEIVPFEILGIWFRNFEMWNRRYKKWSGMKIFEWVKYSAHSWSRKIIMINLDIHCPIWERAPTAWPAVPAAPAADDAKPAPPEMKNSKKSKNA